MKLADIEQLLPGVFQRTVWPGIPRGVLGRIVWPGSPLATILGLMEALHEPSERVLQNLDRFLDLRRTDDSFVPYLAGWVDLAWLLLDPPDDPSGSVRAFPTGLGRLRELGAAATYHSRWRGTTRGLLDFLLAATGDGGFEVQEQVPGPDGAPIPFHVRIRVPAGAEAHIDLIRRIVEHEKPAHVTYELETVGSGDGGDRADTAPGA